MKYFITGGCGFLGSNLAAKALADGHDLCILDNLSREGAAQNLKWLQGQGKFTFIQGDVRTSGELEKVVKDFAPNVIFHLAGQVAMTTSLDNPRLDFEINVLGGFNLLEAVRKFAPETTVIYSSTNKVYGGLEKVPYREEAKRYVSDQHPNGFDEFTSLDFQSPYGCSKGTIDQYMLDYARIYGLKTVVFRHSSIFGGRQFSTRDQAWVGWFIKEALRVSNGSPDPIEICGDGKQVRDLLFIDDLVSCYFTAAKNIEKVRGEAFNLGGGQGNSLSLLELLDFLGKELGVAIKIKNNPWRQSDQKIFIADISKIKSRIDWTPKVDRFSGLKEAVSWVREEQRLSKT